jgi:hypothetical protein
MATPLVTVAAYINGRWREDTFSTADSSWKESLKILKAASIPVKLIYSSKEN